MRLIIVAPCGMLCHTQIDKVSLPGEQGMFTVLRGHAPLIARLVAGEIVFTEKDKETRLEIRNGFVRVENDTVEVCAETPDNC